MHMINTKDSLIDKGRYIYSKNVLITGNETSLALIACCIQNSVEDQNEGPYTVDLGKLLLSKEHTWKFNGYEIEPTFIFIEGVDLWSEIKGLTNPLTEKLHVTTEFTRGPKDFAEYRVLLYRKTWRDEFTNKVEVQELTREVSEDDYKLISEYGVLSFCRENLAKKKLI